LSDELEARREIKRIAVREILRAGEEFGPPDDGGGRADDEVAVDGLAGGGRPGQRGAVGAGGEGGGGERDAPGRAGLGRGEGLRRVAGERRLGVGAGGVGQGRGDVVRVQFEGSVLGTGVAVEQAGEQDDLAGIRDQ
jgi:hypothetical protein